MNMIRIASVTLYAASLFANGGYKAEPAGAPPAELAPAILAELQSDGHKVTGPDGKVLCEVWFRKTAPQAPPTSESDVSWKTTPLGGLLGAIRFPSKGSDRRGQNIQPGVYTLRFSLYPINGDHQGVAPQRDFLVLSPASIDKNLEPVKVFDELMNHSRKVSGTPHPAVLSMWKVESDFQPGMSQAGEHDWALQAKVGDVQVALILVGKAE